jgi:ABC-2 type transport system permease protein
VKVFKTLLRRELGVCFGVLNGYVIVSAALFLVGVCFYDLVYRLNNQPTDMTLTEMFFFSWYFWLILLLSAPLITMRTFAHEKSTGTYEILMTAPVNDIQVLMSKFCGALFFHAIIWLPVFISMLLLRFYINNPLVVNITSIITTYFAVLMVGALYISIGCFGSALTRSQIVAGMVSFTLGMGIFMLSVNVLFVVPDPGPISLILAKVSLADYMRDCSRGILDSRPFIFLVTSTFLFLFLTWRVLEWRRWR